jgi:hypothetical protein
MGGGIGVYDFFAFIRFASSEKLSPEAVLGLLGCLVAILLAKLLMLVGGEMATSSSRLMRLPAMAGRDEVRKKRVARRGFVVAVIFGDR